LTAFFGTLAASWSRAILASIRQTAIITEGLETRAFPAASVDVGTANGPVWQQAFGQLTYENAAPPASLDTIFDLASLTKVIATHVDCDAVRWQPV
jgi:CubicO group peptidase (beta-lactamase class C family)